MGRERVCVVVGRRGVDVGVKLGLVCLGLNLDLVFGARNVVKPNSRPTKLTHTHALVWVELGHTFGCFTPLPPLRGLGARREPSRSFRDRCRSSKGQEANAALLQLDVLNPTKAGEGLRHTQAATHPA